MTPATSDRDNENSLRRFPFSENSRLVDDDGGELGTNVFVDAIFYPVSGAGTRCFLYDIDYPSGVVRVLFCRDIPDITEYGWRDAISEKQLLTGNKTGSVIEFEDWRGRHAGTLACGSGWNEAARINGFKSFPLIEFSASVCCPVNPSFVTGFSDSYGRTTKKRTVVLQGDGFIVPVLRKEKDGTPVLSFDLVPKWYHSDVGNPLKQLVMSGIGHRAFNLSKMADGSVLVDTPGLDRDAIRSYNMREAILSKSGVVDICNPSGADDNCYATFLTVSEEQTMEAEPSSSGNVNLVSALLGAANAVSVTVVNGTTLPVSPQYDGLSKNNAESAMKRIMSGPETHGNGIRISIPGTGHSFIER